MWKTLIDIMESVRIFIVSIYANEMKIEWDYVQNQLINMLNSKSFKFSFQIVFMIRWISFSNKSNWEDHSNYLSLSNESNELNELNDFYQITHV